MTSFLFVGGCVDIFQFHQRRYCNILSIHSELLQAEEKSFSANKILGKFWFLENILISTVGIILIFASWFHF